MVPRQYYGTLRELKHYVHQRSYSSSQPYLIHQPLSIYIYINMVDTAYSTPRGLQVVLQCSVYMDSFRETS